MAVWVGYSDHAATVVVVDSGATLSYQRSRAVNPNDLRQK